MLENFIEVKRSRVIDICCFVKRGLSACVQWLCLASFDVRVLLVVPLVDQRLVQKFSHAFEFDSGLNFTSKFLDFEVNLEQ